RLFLQRLQPLGPAGDADRLVAAVGQGVAQGAGQLDLIVHDQEPVPLLRGHRLVLSLVRRLDQAFAGRLRMRSVLVPVRTGSTIRTRVPRLTSLSIWMSPWCSSMTRRQMARPRPV